MLALSLDLPAEQKEITKENFGAELMTSTVLDPLEKHLEFSGLELSSDEHGEGIVVEKKSVTFSVVQTFQTGSPMVASSEVILARERMLQDLIASQLESYQKQDDIIVGVLQGVPLITEEKVTPGISEPSAQFQLEISGAITLIVVPWEHFKWKDIALSQYPVRRFMVIEQGDRMIGHLILSTE